MNRIEPHEIVLFRGNTKEPVLARVEPINVEWLTKLEVEWSVARRQLADAALLLGKETEHVHAGWSWANLFKVDWILAGICSGAVISVNGMPEGAMLYRTEPRPAKLGPDLGLPTVYVSVIEAAPWNAATLVGSGARFRPVGARLVRAAILASLAENCGGRICLEALPQANRFYERLGFIQVPDASPYGLPYYEMTSAAANRFLHPQAAQEPS